MTGSPSLSPSAVLFDLDLTLCVHDQSTEQLLAETFERCGVEQFCTPADLASVVDDVPSAETATEFYEFCFAAAARRADPDDAPAADTDHAPSLGAAYHDATDYSAVSFRPGAQAALAATADSQVGLVTNGGRATQTTKLDALGIADTFDVTVFCDPVEGVEPKPDAVPFERALSALDADPADAVHVGDSLAADVAGANALGIDSVWIPHDDAASADDQTHRPTHTLGCLSELPALL